MEHFGTIAFTPAARRRQEARGSLPHYDATLAEPAPETLGAAEVDFLQRRDSFYLASAGEGGWPYVQHRGGPAGFVHVIGPTTIAWLERSGNRQYVTTGNLDHDDRVALIAVDHPNRRRLKLLGHARFDADPPDELRRRLADAEPAASSAASTGNGRPVRAEGVVTVEVVAVDWNCPKFITPRWTAEEVAAATTVLTDRIAELEARLAALGASG